MAEWRSVSCCFFAVNPVFLVILGAFAGRAIKTRWSLPLAAAAFYLAGTWVFFDRGERAFLLYASAYLVLGTAAMLVSAFFRKRARLTYSIPSFSRIVSRTSGNHSTRGGFSG